MKQHDAEYYRLRRRRRARASGEAVQSRDYTQSPAALARGQELRKLEQLPLLAWPTDLFSVQRHRL